MPIPTTPAETASPVFSARLEPGGALFEAPASLPLLLSAERAGLALLDSSCRNGTCRACICQLLSGQVMYRIDWPGLSLMRSAKAASCPAWRIRCPTW